MRSPNLELDLAEPFTFAEAARAGITRSQVRTMLGNGIVRYIFQGVLVDSSARDSVRLRAAALAKVVPARSIICDATSAWLRGVDILAEQSPVWLPPLDLYRHDGEGVRRDGCTRGKRTLDLDYDVEEVEGVLTTTMLRTACDLGRLRRRRDAFIAMNALASGGRFDACRVRDELPRYRGLRGVVQLRSLSELVTPTVESPAESVVLLQIIDAGLPWPRPQWLVRDRYGDLIARLDFGYPEIKLAVEFDGQDFHSSAEQRAHDRRRRRRLEAEGWTLVVLTKAHVFVPQPTTAAMVRAGIEQAMAKLAV